MTRFHKRYTKACTWKDKQTLITINNLNKVISQIQYVKLLYGKNNEVEIEEE